MRPKHYPYSGKIKASTSDIVKAMETAYSEFLVKNKETQESSKRELDKATLELLRRYRIAHW